MRRLLLLTASSYWVKGMHQFSMASTGRSCGLRIVATCSLLVGALISVACASQAEMSPLTSCCNEPALEAAKSPCCDEEKGLTAQGAEDATAAPAPQPAPEDASASSERRAMRIPDVLLVDQHGTPVRFYSDLVRGKVVAMSFFFTTCTTICPPLTINMAEVRRLLAERAGSEVDLISITVDPVVDTPQRLLAWAEKFGVGPGWTLVTGQKKDVDDLLKALSAFTAIKEQHTPFILIGNEVEGRWTRVNGLASPTKLLAAIDQVRGDSAAVAATATSTGARISMEIASASGTSLDEATLSPEASVSLLDASSVEAASEARSSQSTTAAPTNVQALDYFTDVELLDQDGQTRRFYSDLLRGKVVVIDCFFSQCTSVCPALNSRLQRIQEAYADRLGKDLHLISLSVDFANDTPERLRDYAARVGAREGWYFLTGTAENISLALRKVGLFSETRDAHSTVFLIGNDKTGLWKKAMGLAREEEVLRVVASVLEDGND